MDPKLRPQLFHDLCADLGFCLRREDIARLLEHPPKDVYSTTNAVFAAEGLNPETQDQNTWRQVRGYVAASFDNG